MSKPSRLQALKLWFAYFEEHVVIQIWNRPLTLTAVLVLCSGWSAWKVYMEMRTSKAAFLTAQARKRDNRMAYLALTSWREALALSRAQSEGAAELAR